MFESDTGETSRFKIKDIEPIANIEGTTNSGVNSQDASSSHDDDNQIPFTVTAQKKTDKHKRRKKKGRQKYLLNLSHQIQRILPPQKIQSRKLRLLKTKDLK